MQRNLQGSTKNHLQIKTKLPHVIQVNLHLANPGQIHPHHHPHHRHHHLIHQNPAEEVTVQEEEEVPVEEEAQVEEEEVQEAQVEEEIQTTTQ